MSPTEPDTSIVPAAEAGLEQAVEDTVTSTTAQLASEKIVVAAPLSYAGSAARIWKITQTSDLVPYKIALGTCAVFLIASAWIFVTAWYLFFGLLLVPYRLVRRGSRKRKRESLQHREMLSAIEKQRQS